VIVSLTIYQASMVRHGRGFGSQDERAESAFEMAEVDSIGEAVERCVRRVADDDCYSVSSSHPDGDFAFISIRAATPVEVEHFSGGLVFDQVAGESDVEGEVCGQLVKFDLSLRVAERARALRAEAERQRRAIAEEAARRSRELEAERQAREERALYEKLKRKFETAAVDPALQGEKS
jgi:hypothetical protein